MAKTTFRKLREALIKELNNTQKEFRRSVARFIGPEIRETLMKGNSPVAKGPRRQPEYSDEYLMQMGVVRVQNIATRKITQRKARRGAKSSVMGTDGKMYNTKRPRPVNLNVSGDMHASQRTKVTKKGVEVTYTKKVDGRNVAADHNDGYGKLPERRILPNRPGEEFSRRIQSKLKKMAKEFAQRHLKFKKK